MPSLSVLGNQYEFYQICQTQVRFQIYQKRLKLYFHQRKIRFVKPAPINNAKSQILLPSHIKDEYIFFQKLHTTQICRDSFNLREVFLWKTKKISISQIFICVLAMNRVNAFQIIKLMKYSQQQFDMKNINLFLLTVGLLICSSFSLIAYGMVGPFSKAAFKCLYSTPNNSGFNIIRVYKNSAPAGIDPNGLATMINAYQSFSVFGGYNYANLYVELCRGVNPTDQINLVRDQIITPFYNTNPPQYLTRSNRWFVMKVQPCTNPSCTWSKYNHSSNCAFLSEAVKAVNKLNWYATVSSSVTSWKKIFGNSCDNFKNYNGANLIYANYDSNGRLNTNKSWDDFIPFGGWQSNEIVLKLISGAVRIPLNCAGSPPTNALVETYWR